MLILAEIAESDPNFRNCPQYRKSQLFLNWGIVASSLPGRHTFHIYCTACNP